MSVCSEHSKFRRFVMMWGKQNGKAHFYAQWTEKNICPWCLFEELNL